MDRFAILLTAVLLWSQNAAEAQIANGYIGVFGDADGTIHCTHAPPGMPVTLYIVAKTSGATAPGIVGAEFRVEFSAPEGYLMNFLPPDGASALGNPLQGPGLTISFPSCCVPFNGAVGLGRIMVLNMGNGGASNIVVKRRQPPSHMSYPCALLVHCDEPFYSKSCATAPADSVACLSEKSSPYDVKTQTDEFQTALDGGTASTLDPERFYEGFATINNSSGLEAAMCTIASATPNVVTRTSAWVGLDNLNSLSTKVWAQSGWLKSPTQSGNITVCFYEYRKENGVRTLGPLNIIAPGSGLYGFRKNGANAELIMNGTVYPMGTWASFQTDEDDFIQGFYGVETININDCFPGSATFKWTGHTQATYTNLGDLFPFDLFTSACKHYSYGLGQSEQVPGSTSSFRVWSLKTDCGP